MVSIAATQPSNATAGRTRGMTYSNPRHAAGVVGLQRLSYLCFVVVGLLYGGFSLLFSSPPDDLTATTGRPSSQNAPPQALPPHRAEDLNRTAPGKVPPLGRGNARQQQQQQQQPQECPVSSLSSLAETERRPRADPTSPHSRHMVDPPGGGRLTLVCCETTKGRFSALLHHAWAPLGVARLVDMVRTGYFSRSSSSAGVALFRCTDACQFGLAGDPNETRRYDGRLLDDPQWMPPGPAFRRNKHGVARYPRGFWTYAGGGTDSRTNQFVLTLRPNQFMGGGSPWEVPLGELVGNESFALLPLIYTGYGERGPSQRLLRNEGSSERVRREWPLMDYILGCQVMDEGEDG